MDELRIDKKIVDVMKQKVEINNALIKLIREMDVLNRYEATKRKINSLPDKKEIKQK